MFGIRMNLDPALYLDPDQSSAVNKVEIFSYLRLFFQVTTENYPVLNHTEEDTVGPSIFESCNRR